LSFWEAAAKAMSEGGNPSGEVQIPDHHDDPLVPIWHAAPKEGVFREWVALKSDFS
jgi:hypothetical protein